MMTCPSLFIADYKTPPRSAYCLCALTTLAKQITALSTPAMLCPARSCSAHIADSSD